MLDIKLLRNEPDKVQEAVKNRGGEIDLSEFAMIDKKRREILQEVEALKNKQNTVSKQIPIMKKEGKDTAPVFEEMNEIKGKIKDLDSEIAVLDEKLKNIVMTIPNIPNEKVKKGLSDAD
ncbi:MAG: serine--tRNA ligase, partial [Clostridia bacterium]|nr:serine--tRNA ligase [Clostridia bacterium]